VPMHNLLQNIDVSLQPSSCKDIVSALVTSTQEIPGRTIQLITCKVKGKTSCFEESMESLVDLPLCCSVSVHNYSRQKSNSIDHECQPQPNQGV